MSTTILATALMSDTDYYLKLPSDLFPANLRKEIWDQVKDNQWVKRERVLAPHPESYVRGHQGNITWWKTELDRTADRYREIFASNLSDTLNEVIKYDDVLLSLQKIKSDKGRAFGVHFDKDICSIQMVLHGDKNTKVRFWNDDPRQSTSFNTWGNFPSADAEVRYKDDIVYLNTIRWHDNNGLMEDRYLLRFILNLNQQSHLNFDYFRKKLE